MTIKHLISINGAAFKAITQIKAAINIRLLFGMAVYINLKKSITLQLRPLRLE